MLNGSNFSEWKEHLLLMLALMDLDISLIEERPDALKHTEETKRWDRSNRVSMMIMRIRIPPKFRGIVPDNVTTAKGYLAAVEKCYVKSQVEEEISAIDEFDSPKRKNESVREYIMMKMDAASKLRYPDYFVVHNVLKSLPSEYFEVKCNPKDENWSIHDVINKCVHEEEIIKWKIKEDR